MTVTELTAWAEIVEAFDAITERDIRRVQRGLSKMRPDENPLGVLHSEALKKLWVLADHYDGAAKQAAIDSAHKAETDEQAEELKHRAFRFVALEEIARNLFWTQAKDDIGAWGHTGSISLREDWMLVCSPSTARSSLQALLGSIIRPPE